jgi:hypothetical protein
MITTDPPDAGCRKKLKENSMTKIQRKTIREKIIAAINEITAENSNKDSVVTIGGHAIERRLLFAGGSQWCGCGRDWDSCESGWAWVVDGEYRLTTPDLFGFDGHNMIETQTGYYLMSGYDQHATPPGEPDGDPLDRVPNAVLIEIGRGLVEAKNKAEAAAAAEAGAADELLAKL